MNIDPLNNAAASAAAFFFCSFVELPLIFFFFRLTVGVILYGWKNGTHTHTHT